MIKVTVTVPNLAKEFTGIAKQVRFATAVAMTRTARAIKEELVGEMRSKFDRPTPYTLNALAVKPARRDDLSAEVFLKNSASKAIPASKFLAPQILGGSRRHKRFERSLEAAGLLPKGMQAVPGQAAKLDAYGNMSRGQIVKILSYLRASADPTQNRGAGRGRGSRRMEEYFVARPRSRAGHLRPGIYLRTPDGPRPVVIYVQPGRYRVRFDFAGVAARVAAERFPAEMERAFDEAVATSR